MTSTTLIRQRDGDRLVLDAVIDGEFGLGYDVTEHAVESQGSASLASVNDYVRRRPRTVALSIVISETPPDTATRGGPGHVADVLDWLEASAGERLTVAVAHRPSVKNLVIRDQPWQLRAAEDAPIRLLLQEIAIVEASETQIAGVTGKRTRPDRADARAEEKDKGVAATEESNDTFLRAALRLIGF